MDYSDQNDKNLAQFIEELHSDNVALIAVSKTRSIEQIFELYKLGIRDFGENRIQELRDKKDQLPEDIRWHLIGHLQKNKIKHIISYIHLIHSVDRFELLNHLEKQAHKHNKTVNILLQLKVAEEESKYGLTAQNLIEIIDKYISGEFPHIQIHGIMAMASFVNDEEQIKAEFLTARDLFNSIKARNHEKLDKFKTLSMGMSGDYKMAIHCGSNMVRIGSLLFNKFA